MKKEEALEYTQSLGQIVGGAWRQIALAKKLGVPKALGLEVDVWVKENLGGYVKMTVEDRREAVKELTAEGENNTAIAEIVGVDESTVREDKGTKKKSGNPEPVVAAPAENSQSEDIKSGNPEPNIIDAVAALSVDASKVAHVSNNSGENEWYTPSYIIEAARNVMGSIDLDPASSDIANQTVGAEKYFTIDDDGLNQEWFGNVWLNPPYGSPLIGQFAKALAKKQKDGEFEQACVIVNNATETAWFQQILKLSVSICFLKSRVKFLDVEGNPKLSPLQGQAVLYFGGQPKKFREEFASLGICLRG